MPQKGKSGITCDTETLEVLKQDKPDGVTWDYYLRSMYQCYVEADATPELNVQK